MNTSNRWARRARWSLLALVLVPLFADAQRGGGMARSSVSASNRSSQMAMDKGRQNAARTQPSSGRNSTATRPNGNGDRSTTRQTNINNNTNVNIDMDGNDSNWGNGQIDRPLAATAVVAATTAAVVGSFYPSVPAGCPIVNTYSVPYYHCNGVYYEQRMQGDDVVYVVVNP
ncbi:hypothetical protein [Lysobacter sp. HA35]